MVNIIIMAMMTGMMMITMMVMMIGMMMITEDENDNDHGDNGDGEDDHYGDNNHDDGNDDENNENDDCHELVMIQAIAMEAKVMMKAIVSFLKSLKGERIVTKLFLLL